MGEIKDFVKLYIEESDLIAPKVIEISNELKTNMRSNLWKGHGYDKGELYRDIYSNYTLEKGGGVVIGGYTVEHGQYVISGVRGKGTAKSGPIDFLSDGLNKTVEAYR